MLEVDMDHLVISNACGLVIKTIHGVHNTIDKEANKFVLSQSKMLQTLIAIK